MGKKGESKGLVGTWHIYEMEQWNEDYFNMDVQAYITIKPNGLGAFQFGLVSGAIDGAFDADGETFEFTWEGNDECDPASGSGLVSLKGKDLLEGEFEFDEGDSSTFLAKRAK